LLLERMTRGHKRRTEEVILLVLKRFPTRRRGREWRRRPASGFRSNGLDDDVGGTRNRRRRKHRLGVGGILFLQGPKHGGFAIGKGLWHGEVATMIELENEIDGGVGSVFVGKRV
jgi:hypothetical protein